MASTPPSKADRDKNLDSLKESVKEWAEYETKRLENETKYLRAVLEGRTGSKKVASTVLDVASTLVQNEIKAFLEYGADEKR